MELTKDADKMLCCLYKEYLQRIKLGNSKTSSRDFYADYTKTDKFLSTWHEDDIATVRNELGRKHFLKVNILGDFTLTDDAITYMENRFKNNLSELTDFISKFIP